MAQWVGPLPWTKRSLIQFWARAWVVGEVPSWRCARGNPSMFLLHINVFFPPFPLIGCPLHAPNWVPSPQTRHVPWLGTKPATFWFAGWCSIHWATSTKALCSFNTGKYPLFLASLSFKKYFIYLFLEREEGREEERERNMSVWEIHQSLVSIIPLRGDPAHNLGMCPAWESNQ